MSDEQIIISCRILEDSDVATTLDNISKDVGASKKDVRVILRRLVRLGYLYTTAGRFFCTNEGLDSIEAARERPYPIDEWSGWAEEVLTGIDNNGDPTEICNPALPKGKTFSEGNHIEDRFIREITSSSLARELVSSHPWLPVDKLAEYWREGLITECSACGQLGVHRLVKGGRSKTCVNCQRG